MAAEQPQPTIADGAELCLRSFQQCLHLSASIHPRELSLVEDQFARFSIWTASIGVFAPGRASMDHRLREAQDIHEIVRGLLDGLKDNIQKCSSILDTIGNSQSKNFEGTLIVTDEGLDRSLRAIANEISLLHRLSNTIRRASKESQNLKAARLFRIKDDDRNDAEPLLREIFANYILGRFPDINDTIRQRLASTMLLRRKRVLYRRSRYGKTPIRPNKTILQPKITLPQAQQQTTVAPENPQPLDGPKANANLAQSVVQSMAISATTLAADDFKKASTPSVVSVTKTVALGNHEDLVFPPAPTGLLKQRYKPMKKQREKDHKAYLNGLKPLANQTHQVLAAKHYTTAILVTYLDSLFGGGNYTLSIRRGYFHLQAPSVLTEEQLRSIKEESRDTDSTGEGSLVNRRLLESKIPRQESADTKKLDEERNRQRHLDPDALSENVQKISDDEARLQMILEKDWKYCCQVIAEVTCPFCFYVLPSLDVIDEKKWRTHVKNDLDAYICLFEACDNPEELYNHSGEWLKHMREHALRWRCTSKSHGVQVFDMQAKYVDHMRKSHGPFTEAQLRVLAERNAQLIGPLFESCPFCGTKEAKGRLEDHIVGHLRSLALRSLPPYQDEGSEDSKNEKGSLGTSEPLSRSTIKMDSERYTPPTFIDAGERSSLQERGRGKITAKSPYSPWGGYKNYITQFPRGCKMPPRSSDRSPLGVPFPLPNIISIPDDILDDNKNHPLRDPSIEFVEDSLLDEAPDNNRRIWEWGFTTEVYGESDSLEKDPIIQSIVEHHRKKLSEESIQRARAQGIGASATSGMASEQAKGGWDGDNENLSHSSETDVETGILSSNVGQSEENPERTFAQGKEVIQMAALYEDPNYFRIIDNQDSETDFAPQLHGIKKEVFSPNYFKRFFVEEKELGRGGRGVVLLVRHELDGVSLGHFACRRIPIRNDNAWLEKVLVEVQLLAGLSHPNLVSYRHVWLEAVKLNPFSPAIPCAFILQQYCNSGDLLKYIIGPPLVLSKEELKERMRRRSRGEPKIPMPPPGERRLPLKEIYAFFKDVTSGLAYLHASHFIHRDLKPSNVLLHREIDETRALISDFGEIQHENETQNKTNIGIVVWSPYCAPELLKKDELGRYGNHTTKSDIFSLGLILHFMCFGKLPYKDEANDQQDIYDEDEVGSLKTEIVSWKGWQDGVEERGKRPELPNQLFMLLKILLAVDPIDRPSADDVLDTLLAG